MARQVKLQSESRGPQSKVFLLFGLGYVARALLPALKDQGFQVYATVRTDAQAENCAALGITPLMFRGGVSPDLSAALRRATHILSSAAPNETSDPFVQAFGGKLQDSAPNIVWAGYLSAIGVYGNRNGQWVFEEEWLRPSTQRGRRRIMAELDWYESGLPIHIFRLAGIYGKGRNSLKGVKNGTTKAIIKDGHISNRIHVSDIAAALMRSLARPNPLRIYNLADDTPAPPQDTLNFAAKLLGTSVPHIAYDQAELSPIARSFYQDDRRISNARARQELGWKPEYPSYKEGLTALFKTGY